MNRWLGFTQKNASLLLIGLLFVAFFLRFNQINEHGLAGDEKYSLFVSQFVSYEGNNQTNSVRKPNNPYFTPKEFWSEKTIHDFYDSIARVDTGNGALYTFSLHYWSKLVGLADGNLRLLSVIFNILTIILLYVFVKKHFNSPNLALLASFLATISPFYINFSQVARNYSMQFFFALLATHIFLLIIRESKSISTPPNPPHEGGLLNSTKKSLSISGEGFRVRLRGSIFAIKGRFLSESSVASSQPFSYEEKGLISQNLTTLPHKGGFANSLTNSYKYIIYGLSVLACLLCHISTFPLFFIHGLFLLIYHRHLKLIVSFGLAMLIPLVGILLWLKSDGGKYLFEYVAHSTDVYNEMARTAPDEYLSVATFSNIFKQLRHVISCSFINLEGIYLKLFGLKDLIVVVTASMLAFIQYIIIKNEKVKLLLIGLIGVSAAMFSSIAKVESLILYLNLLLLYFLIWHFRKAIFQSKYQLLHFLLLLIIVPFIFLVLFSLKDGNTFRIIPRYTGYSYAFGLIAISLVIRYLYSIKDSIKYYFFAGFLIQFFMVLTLINKIWEDNPPRYFMSFNEPRKQNPYKTAADKILQLYSKSDTVLYCSTYATKVSEGKDMPAYSVIDAQLTNFYLPKNSEIIQRIDPAERNKIILKKNDGRRIEIINFENERLRY